MDRDYQAMFHPFRDESVGKGKGLAKAVGLWVATLGIYPLVAGIKHYRAKQKTQGDLNPAEGKTKNIGKRLSTALRNLQPAPSTTPTQSTLPNPGTTHPELPKEAMPATAEDPQVDEVWNAEVTDVIAKAKEGDKNALFQLLVWQSERRNLGGLDLVEGQNPEAIIDDAAAIGNPLAINWKISGLEYNKRTAILKGQSTEAITEQINTLRTQLEQIAAEGNVEAQRLLQQS